MTFYIDGNNVGQWRENNNFCIATVLTLCRELKKNGHDYICYFDANAPYLPKNIRERKIFEEVLKDKNKFWITTGRTKADDFILVAANRDKASVISNDQYRDVPTQYPWLNEDYLPKRLFKGGVLPTVNGPLLSIIDLKIENYVETDLESLVSEMNSHQSRMGTKPFLTKERRLFFKYELIKLMIRMFSYSDHSDSFELIKNGILDRNLFKSINLYLLNDKLQRVAEFKINVDLANDSVPKDDNLWELHYNLITPAENQSPASILDVYSYFHDIKNECVVKYSDIWYSWRDEVASNPAKLKEAKEFCGLSQSGLSLPPWDINILEEDIEYSKYLIEFIENGSSELVVIIN